MYVNKDGWLVASPHRTVPIQGKNVVDTTDMLGDYKLITTSPGRRCAATAAPIASSRVDRSGPTEAGPPGIDDKRASHCTIRSCRA